MEEVLTSVKWYRRFIFGNWVYLIALNILVLDMTGSAAAVAGIYIVGPIARMLTNFWAGSIIDRVNKRKLMVLADVLRGSLILLVPFLDSLWIVYSILFATNIAGAFLVQVRPFISQNLWLKPIEEVLTRS